MILQSLLLTLTLGAEPLTASVPAVRADLKRLTPVYQQSTRYLLIPKRIKDPKRFGQMLAGHVNHLSTESELVKPPSVAQDGRLLKLSVDDYGPRWRAVWDKLAESDPYGTVKITKAQQFGTRQPDGTFTNVFTKQVVVSTAVAPWFEGAAELVTLTGSPVPVVRADWFLWQTSLQADRGGAGYYDFLGVKDQKSYEDLVGLDRALLDRTRRLELLEATNASGVKKGNVRRIAAFNTVGDMKLWRTFDSNLAVDKKNPLRVLDRKELEFDAQEDFGPLPNGLWGVGLFDKDGRRQDTAPDFIGFDSTSDSNDGRIHVYLSCVRCHYGNGGLNPVKAWVRGLDQGGLKLQSPDPAKLRELRQHYLRDFDGPMADDRLRFARNLKAITGMTPVEYADELGRAFADYDADVTLERAAEDVGLSPQELTKAIKAYIVATGSADTVLVALTLPKGTIPVESYHEAIPLLHVMLKGVGK